MLLAVDSPTLTFDVAWPWSLPTVGPWALALVALLLIALTVWTYLGISQASVRRVLVILGLRLAALVLAVLMLLRPALAFRDELHLPSILLLLLDRSQSMTIQDEFGGQSRWEALQDLLKESEPFLKQLQDEQNVTVVTYQFAEEAREASPDAKPDGKRSDFGQALQTLYKTHGRDRNLRGLFVLSDGADNGTRFPALAGAAHWRGLPCPASAFGLGQPTTSDRQRDVALLAVNPEPAPVPVKAKLTVKAVVDAPGFENATVTFRVFIDDQEAVAKEELLRKTTGNEVVLVVDAPNKPGEIKLTLKADPLPGEVTTVNNEISTYVTVTKEGISVLIVDKPRFYEPQRIADALSTDPRMRVYYALRGSDEPAANQGDLFDFDKQRYDVIIVGDLTAQRFTGGNPQALTQIEELVRDKGSGFMMIGGYQNFGNGDWNGTPVASLLPVELEAAGQTTTRSRIEPTPAGLAHFIMRLTDRPADNQTLWAKLPDFESVTKFGQVKPGATVLAVRVGTQEPVLVGQKYGEGRTLAFAGDETYHWEKLGAPKSQEGTIAHHRFWRQVVLWLARQDEAEGSVWVKPEARRLTAGSKLGFTVGLRGKGGMDLKDARFQVEAVGPQQDRSVVPTAQEKDGERGTFWKTDAPGEYRLVVRGKGKDTDGTEVSGEATARFIVYQDEAELLRRAADHDFLNRLANAGGGKFYRAQELPNVLRQLHKLPLPQSAPKTHLWPDWRRNSLNGFHVGFFLTFVAVLCLEWFLRRSWGLV